ncbi:MAG: hypothetical protein ABN482_00550 [Corticimicrobacter sp.]|uniref:hypothetical protein n=1 Tax=Corticimicrobacter sp. TaxID=2678536 RepID=UPI0032DA8489
MNWKEKILAAMKQYQIAVAFIVGAPFGWMVVRYWPSDPGHAAAWVQAIGTIGAVISAILVARHQSRESQKMLFDQWEREENNERQLRKTKLRSISGVVVRCAETAKSACGSLLDVKTRSDFSKDLINQKSRLEDAIKWIDGMPIGSDPGILISLNVVNIRLSIKRIVELIDQAKGMSAMSAHKRDRLHALHRSLTLHSSSINDYIESYDGAYEEILVSEL